MDGRKAGGRRLLPRLPKKVSGITVDRILYAQLLDKYPADLLPWVYRMLQRIRFRTRSYYFEKRWLIYQLQNQVGRDEAVSILETTYRKKKYPATEKINSWLARIGHGRAELIDVEKEVWKLIKVWPEFPAEVIGWYDSFLDRGSTDRVLLATGRKPDPEHPASDLGTSTVIDTELGPLVRHLDGLQKRYFTITKDQCEELKAYVAETRARCVRERQYCASTLAMILDYPKVPYQQRRAGGRLFAVARGYQYLPRDLRARLQPTWLELDWRSCHVAIQASATIFDLPGVVSQLRALSASGRSLWEHLYQLWPKPIYPLDKVKPRLKEAVYSLAYGKGKRKITKFLRKVAPGLAKAFWSSPIVSAIFEARRIWQEDYARGESGKWHLVDAKGKRRQAFQAARSQLALECQQIEGQLMQPIYDYLLANRYTIVMLPSHDGCSFRFTEAATADRRESIVGELGELGRTTAARLGIATEVEVGPPSRTYVPKVAIDDEDDEYDAWRDEPDLG